MPLADMGLCEQRNPLPWPKLKGAELGSVNRQWRRTYGERPNQYDTEQDTVEKGEEQLSGVRRQSLSGCEFPLLEELGVRDEDPGDGLDDPVDTFRNVQNVRIMHLYPSDNDLEAYMTLGEFPWSKLLKLGLQQLTGIEELTMTTIYIAQSLLDALSGRLIVLPALKRLEIMNGTPYADDMEMFLRILRIPSICCLTLSFGNLIYFTALVPHPDFHRLSSLRITCSMTETAGNLQSDYIGTKRLLDFLRPMTGVEEFELKDENVTSEFLDGLVVGAEKGAVLLPSLKTLNLRECGFVNHDTALDSIRRIAESRSPAIKSHNHHCALLERMILPEVGSLLRAA
ncbi:hypothetical protein BDZ89DRAFT_1048514 [Hymenopellis radicata]|nr:hypothetical protein BDZ89DRAFT_1048514 [Hymenopellis radicata]